MSRQIRHVPLAFISTRTTQQHVRCWPRHHTASPCCSRSAGLRPLRYIPRPRNADLDPSTLHDILRWRLSACLLLHLDFSGLDICTVSRIAISFRYSFYACFHHLSVSGSQSGCTTEFSRFRDYTTQCIEHDERGIRLCRGSTWRVNCGE